MSLLYHRLIEPQLKRTLQRDKSILLLGPRQTGKSTLIDNCIDKDVEYTFLDVAVRLRFEKDPDSLKNEILGFKALNPNISLPIVYIDEVQRVPSIMDSVQYLIDKKIAKFILTGSSARKLKKHKDGINLLPGRVIAYHLDVLSLLELENNIPDIEDLLLNGMLPEIIQQITVADKEQLLNSYVAMYLEQEVRAEALVRDLASFSQFLSLAAIEAGNSLNLSSISQDLGISRYTLYEYFRILEDCLIVNRIDPITEHTGRRKLTKSSKYLFFDLGVRRIAAGEGLRLPQKYYGLLFEQFVGMEILKIINAFFPQAKLKYWHDHAGPEVDYVIEYNREYLPIEVKWIKTPSINDAKHLLKFMNEYECAKPALIICQTARPQQLSDSVLAINWSDLPEYIKKHYAKDISV